MKNNQTDSIIMDDAEIEYPASDADTEELDGDDTPTDGEIGEDTIEVYDEEIKPVTKKSKFNEKEHKENNILTSYCLTKNTRIFPQRQLVKFIKPSDKSTKPTFV